jgi:ABC-type antimicrobial peptide transport system permease subunit
VVGGAAVGLVIAFWATGVLSSFLYQTTPLDATTYGMVVATLFSVTIVTVWLPVRRATRLDPLTTLRAE